MQNVLLDFELSKEQLEALNLYAHFKSNRSLEGILDYLTDEIDQIQIWFSIDYNDYTYDVRPIYADLIENGLVVRKVDLYGTEFEIPDYDGGNMMQSITITPKML